MPKPDENLAGAPCWVDLFSSDPDKSRAFYGDLLGWTSEDAGPEYGGYVNFSLDGELVAGCVRNPGDTGTPDTWSVYLRTNDAEATVGAAVAAGGGVVVPAMDVAELGRMAVVTDAGGAAIGIWQPGLHRGFGVVAEPGAPAWFELHTRAYDATVAFYRTVFEWDAHVMSDEPGFRYSTLGAGDDAAAGVMDASASLTEGAPSFWTVYFAVDDADTTLQRVLELGGSVVGAAEDSPYGRLATAADPTGAEFRIVSN